MHTVGVWSPRYILVYVPIYMAVSVRRDKLISNNKVMKGWSLLLMPWSMSLLLMPWSIYLFLHNKRVVRKPMLQPGFGPGVQRSAWQGNQRYSQGWGLGPREAQANIPAHSAATLVAVMQVGVLTWEDDETQTTASTEPAPMAGEAN